MLAKTYGLLIIGAVFIVTGCLEKSGSNTSSNPNSSITSPATEPVDPPLVQVGSMEKISASMIDGKSVDPKLGWLQVSTRGLLQSNEISQLSHKPSGKEDDALEVSAINVVVKEVRAKTADTQEWVLLNSGEHSVNLLNLNNDAKEFFVNSPLPPGSYNEIRFKIDKNATAVINSDSVPLIVPSGASSGIKMKGLFKIEKGYLTKIGFEIDGKKSVVRQNKNRYYLRPVIRIDGVTEDLFPPHIAIVSPTGQITKNTNHSIEIEYSDEFLQLSSLSILIDGVEAKEEFQISEIGALAQKVFSEGTHTIQAKISDKPGFTSVTEPVTLVVDLTPPTISFLDEGKYFSTLNPRLNISLTDNLSGIDLASIRVIVDNLDVTERFSKTDSAWSGELQRLNDGVHNIDIIIKDLAGNISGKRGVFTTDTSPPQLTQVMPVANKKYYTNQLPLSIPYRVLSNETLSEANVNTSSVVVDSDGFSLSGIILANEQGQKTFKVKAKDLAGNESNIESNYEVVFDNVAPTLKLTNSGPNLTNQSSVPVIVEVSELSQAWSKVIINDQVLFETTSTNFSVPFELLKEGVNTFKISSKDEAGNESLSNILEVTRDTLPPQLASSIPSEGSKVYQIQFPISGTSNEALSAASVDGLSLTLSGDAKSFSGSYVSDSEGSKTLVFSLVDKAGNTSQHPLNIDIQYRLLIPELLSIYPDSDGVHVFVKGSAGAVRPGAEVTAGGGVFSFNRGTQIAGNDGSFLIRLELLSSATVTAKDLMTGETQTTVLNYNAATKLSGIVKDTDGTPLPNAKVSIAGTSLSVFTNGEGVFSIDTVFTGDRVLIIDGGTVPQAVTGPEKVFSKTNIAINIGVGQANTLSRPIFLAPLYKDGTQTEIVQSQAAEVTSPRAPGVKIEVKADSAVFPNGQSVGEINISSISSDVATIPVPATAIPDNVIALEPSGLTFNERVTLTLPNENELPPGVRLMIYSMNSTKGIWEIDGEAEVSSDGASVVTLPGKGISHFSLTYAVPMKPLITEVKNPDLIGVDVAQGSLTTTVDLPSYKVLGQSVQPKLTYKSNWANPTAYVTNLFDIPEYEEVLDKNILQQKDILHSHKVCRTLFGWEVTSTCDVQDYLTRVQFDTRVEGKSWYVPESIRAQFFVSNFSSHQAIITNVDEEGGHNVETLPGANFKNSSESEIVTMSGIPSKSLMSFAVPLRNPESGEYLKTGLYPTLSRYEIRLKHMVMYTAVTSRTITTYRTDNGFKLYEEPKTEIVDQKSHEESQLLDALAPEDVISNIALVSKVDSPFGRGWNFGFSQKIINPDSNRILIEEENGDLASYSIDNTISTIYNGSNSSIDFNSAIDISNWPKANFLMFNASNDAQIGSVDLSASQKQIAIEGSVPQSSGVIGNQGYHVCDENNVGNFTATQHTYKTKASLGGIIKTANGDIIFTNAKESNLSKITAGVGSKVFGVTSSVENFANYTVIVIDPLFQTLTDRNVFSASQTNLDQLCISNFGQKCSGAISTKSNSCSKVCFNNRPCITTTDLVTQLPSSGLIGKSTGTFSSQMWFWDSVYSRRCNFFGCTSVPYKDVMGFNNPASIVLSPEGHVVVADTGNNQVLLYDFNSRLTKVIAGNGSSVFVPGNAISAGVFHPQGLAYDSIGNLYISTDDGYIRKVDNQGKISAFAGMPVVNGGTLSNEIHASQMAFASPKGMVVDKANNYLYIADTGNHRVVRIDLATKMAVTIAGNMSCNTVNIGDEKPALNASLCSPTSVGLDNFNNLIIADAGNKRIRRVSFGSASSGVLTYSPTSKDLSVLVKNEDGSWIRTYRNGLKVYFNQLGQHISTADRVGNQSLLEYDADGNLVKVTDAVGQASTFQYSSKKLRNFKDPAGRITYFDYAGDLLVSVNFPDGTARRYEYDSNGQMIKEINQRNVLTHYSYNAYNRLEKVIDATNNVVSLNDMVTQSMTNSYVGGRVGQLQNAGTGLQRIHDTFVDARSVTTEIAKDFNGFVVIIKDGKNQITTIKRDLDGRPLSIVRSDGTEVKFTYDPSTGDLLSTTDVNLDITESQSYDVFGNIVNRVDGRQQVYTYEYDLTSGVLLRESGPSSTSTAYNYNANGLVSSKSTSTGAKLLTTVFEYDSFGNQRKVILPDGKSVQMLYDSAGNVIQKISLVDGAQTAIVKYAYNAFNRPIQVTTPNNEVISYEYLPTGELSKIIDAKGKERNFEYDHLGRLVKKVEATGQMYQMMYDANGNVVQETDPNGNVSVTEYDELNRAVQVRLPDDLIRFNYDLRGEISSVENNISNISYLRDSKNRITKIRSLGLGVMANYPIVDLSMSYDKNGNRTATSSEFMSMVYSFDSSNRLVQLSNSLGDTFGFYYDTANRLNQITRPGSQSSFSYLDSGVVSQILHSSGGITKSFTEYTYDLRNSPIQKRNIAGIFNYSYDPNGQLTSASAISGINEIFSYDSIGNRTTDRYGNYVYDNHFQTLQEDWQYLYFYDNNGNLTLKNPKNQSQKAYKYLYSSKNQLIQIQVLNGTLGSVIQQIEFRYDAIGRRIQKEVIDTEDSTKSYTKKFVYDGDNVLLEYDGNNNITAKYTYSPLSPDDILAAEVTSSGVSSNLSQNSGKVYYLKDALGSVTDIVNSNGNVIQKYDYGAYGKINSVKDAAGNDITSAPLVNTSYAFTGREYEKEGDLYYYRARYYDPNTGRFLQKDPDPGKLRSPATVINRYIYVQNNPAAYIDPSGRFPWLVIALVSFAITAYQNNQHGGNFAQQFAMNFAFSSLVYLIGVGLGGAEFSTAATWQQSAWAATKSLVTSSAVRATAWEAQNRGIASDGTIYALSFLYGVGDNYKSSEFNWGGVSTAIGNTLTFPNIPVLSVDGLNSQVPQTGDTNNGK